MTTHTPVPFLSIKHPWSVLLLQYVLFHVSSFTTSASLRMGVLCRFQRFHSSPRWKLLKKRSCLYFNLAVCIYSDFLHHLSLFISLSPYLLHNQALSAQPCIYHSTYQLICRLLQTSSTCFYYSCLSLDACNASSLYMHYFIGKGVR